jgi:exodeoxyribonuclease V alpha subunit
LFLRWKLRGGPLREQMHTTRAAADADERHAAGARAPLDQHAQAVQASLRADWDSDRPAAAQAARTVNAGTGRFGRGRGRVTDAQRLLTEWADKWRPVQPELTDAAAAARLADRHPAGDRIDNAIHDYAQRRAADAMPHHIQVIRDAEQTRQTARAAERAYLETAGPIRRQQALRHARTGYRDLAEDLPQLTRQATTARDRLTAARSRIHQLTADPALAARPDAQTVLAAAHRSWNLQDTHTQAQALKRAAARQAEQAAQQHTNDGTTRYGPSYPPAAGRRGPSLGR